MNIPTTTEVSWNIPTAYITLSCQSEDIVQNGPVGILSNKIRTEATSNILNPTEASLNIPTAYNIKLLVRFYCTKWLEFSVSGI